MKGGHNGEGMLDSKKVGFSHTAERSGRRIFQFDAAQ